MKNEFSEELARDFAESVSERVQAQARRHSQVLLAQLEGFASEMSDELSAGKRAVLADAIGDVQQLPESMGASAKRKFERELGLEPEPSKQEVDDASVIEGEFAEVPSQAADKPQRGGASRAEKVVYVNSGVPDEAANFRRGVAHLTYGLSLVGRSVKQRITRNTGRKKNGWR